MLALEQDGAPNDVVGIREAAKALGVNASTISRQVAKGVIPNRGASGAPKVSIDEARRARATNLDPSQQRAPEPSPSTSGTFSSHRSAHEAAKAKLAQLDLAQRLGEVVSRSEAEDLFATYGRRVRDALEQKWRTLALELQGMSAADIMVRGTASTEEVLARVAAEIENEWKRPDGS